MRAAGRGRHRSADLSSRGEAVSDGAAAVVRVRGHARRPDGGRLLVGQHGGPEGRHPRARRRRPPRPQPLADARPPRGRRALHADAAVLGRAGSASRSSPPCTPAPRSCSRTSSSPAATLELIERERVTQVLGWPHMAKALVDHPQLHGARPVVDPERLVRRAPAPGAADRRRGAQGQLARDDRDARPPHLRHEGQRAPTGEGGLVRLVGARASSTRSSTRSRWRTCPSVPPASCGSAATR